MKISSLCYSIRNIAAVQCSVSWFEGVADRVLAGAADARRQSSVAQETQMVDEGRAYKRA